MNIMAFIGEILVLLLLVGGAFVLGVTIGGNVKDGH
ncbi:hypothetical protein C5L23_001466 [Leuconostoc fallax]|uniref:Uncharacterized protein n=1 Tax=Leuconostoc fallax TaxID=1251 RepID=A0A4R5N790_9LACO|nr:hypothetical protein C5L23_001466 [Leuconostoc fallax]